MENTIILSLKVTMDPPEAKSVPQLSNFGEVQWHRIWAKSSIDHPFHWCWAVYLAKCTALFLLIHCSACLSFEAVKNILESIGQVWPPLRIPLANMWFPDPKNLMSSWLEPWNPGRKAIPKSKGAPWHGENGRNPNPQNGWSTVGMNCVPSLAQQRLKGNHPISVEMERHGIPFQREWPFFIKCNFVHPYLAN